MAVSGSPPRPETPSMSLFTSRRLLPSGMSRAIKALDKKSATPSHGQVAASKLQSRAGSNADLTNFASRLTCKSLRCAYSNVKPNCQWSLCVCPLKRTKAQPLRWPVDPVPPPLAWRGKFICRPLLVKWLGKMRFLAGPGHHVVDAALL